MESFSSLRAKMHSEPVGWQHTAHQECVHLQCDVQTHTGEAEVCDPKIPKHDLHLDMQTHATEEAGWQSITCQERKCSLQNQQKH